MTKQKYSARSTLKIKNIATIVFLFWPLHATAQIPEWYQRDIANIINKASAVIIYKVKAVTLESQSGPYFSYKIDTETVQELKGKAPKGECYFLQSEGEWKSPSQIGETRVAILAIEYQDRCGTIEPGYSAPATEDYISLFNSIIKP